MSDQKRLAMLKRFLWGLVILIVLALIGAGVVFYLAGQSGSGTIEQWVGRQIQGIANSYLNPKFSFSDLDYEYPGTVRLKDLRLTSDDPSNPGKSIDILGAAEADIQLAEIPVIGKPIIIERVTLRQPLFQAIVAGDGSDELIGFSRFVRVDTVQQDASDSDADGGSTKLSQIFQMRLVELIDGKLTYDPRLPDVPPMQLDQISTRLEIESSNDGWYKLQTTLSRKPVFDLTAAGRLNLDDFNTDQLDVKLAIQLGRDQDHYLPPELQQVLKDHEVEGDLKVEITGGAPVTDWTLGKLDATLELTHANVSFDEYRIPVEKLDMNASLADQILHVPGLRLRALEGNATVIAFVALNDTIDADVKLTANRLRIQDTLRKGAETAEAQYGGLLDADIQVSAPLATVFDASSPTTQPYSQIVKGLPDRWGHGYVHLRDGRLLHLPVISSMADAIGKQMDSGSRSGKPTDRADLAFTLSRDEIQFNDLDIRGSWFAARGAGTVKLNEAIDLTVNGGPLEKMQTLLGNDVGGAIGSVTDSVMAYRVTGTISQTHVTADVGGGAIGETATLAKETGTAVKDTASESGDFARDAGESVKDAGSAIGEGAKEVGQGIKDLFGF
jgi:hypothetical protein